jgi:hypothetical protein
MELKGRAHRFNTWELELATLQTLMRQGFTKTADAVLLSHVIQNFKKKKSEKAAMEVDEEAALAWAWEHTRPGGMVALVLEDTEPIPGSYAHLVQMQGVHKDRNRPPREYAEQLLKLGSKRVSVCQPTLQYQVTGTVGEAALRQIIGDLTADKYADRDKRVEDYINRYLRNPGTKRMNFNQRMRIITAKKEHEC